MSDIPGRPSWTVPLRDLHGRAIEEFAPCDVFYRGAWHRGRVVRVYRKLVSVDILLFQGGRVNPVYVYPKQIAVIGPTYEDVERDLAERRRARAYGFPETPPSEPPADS